MRGGQSNGARGGWAEEERGINGGRGKGDGGGKTVGVVIRPYKRKIGGTMEGGEERKSRPSGEPTTLPRTQRGARLPLLN